MIVTVERAKLPQDFNVPVGTTELHFERPGGARVLTCQIKYMARDQRLRIIGHRDAIPYAAAHIGTYSGGDELWYAYLGGVA